MRAVTARAGVTANALYLHFADREALLSAVMLASYKELRACLRAAVPPGAAPVAQLRAYCLGYVEFADRRPGIYRVMFMTKVRDGVPIPAPGAASGQDEGVDAFNDLLEIVTRCLPDEADAFEQSAYIWAGLHGFVSLRQAISAFPWPDAGDYVDRMIRIHIELYTDQSEGR